MKTFFNLTSEIPPDSREEQARYFSDIFGNDHPLIVEIGSGNGHFLVEYALQHLEKNFIGTEILGGRARKFTQKIEKRCMNNIVIYKGDARQFLWEYIYEDSVAEFIVNFPDPWPKKRHHKHRLLQQAFIEMLHDRLRRGGTVSIATDDALYRNWIIDEFKKTDGFRNLYQDGYTKYPDHFPKSLFEQRFREEKRDLFFLQYEKV